MGMRTCSFLRLFAEKVGVEVYSAWQSRHHVILAHPPIVYPSYQALTYYCGWTVLVGLQSFAGEEHYGESLQARLVI